jgi:5-(aminomethyl)-3-furanmethanol phosphate kinase
VLTVVKVGGGLARAPDALRALCEAIGAAGARHRLLVVPGGGELADAVREHDRRFGLSPETAHWMAILAMDQLGWALSELIPGAVRRTDLGTGDGVAVLLPYALLRERDPLPASWEVTSDSIAAWVASAAGAQRLVLVKPAADRLGVDRHFATTARVEAWAIDGREPAQLTELLDTGSTAGARLVAPSNGGR